MDSGLLVAIGIIMIVIVLYYSQSVSGFTVIGSFIRPKSDIQNIPKERFYPASTVE